MNIKHGLDCRYEIFLILRRLDRDMILNVHTYLCRMPVILVRFSLNWNFPDTSSTNTQISNFFKFRPVGDELQYADGQTDRHTDRHDEPNSHFSQIFEGA